LANVLGIPTSKTDMDGSMVQEVYYKEKNLQRIADYCQRDVVVTANVILRFKNLPILKPENIVVVES
jgi:predicted PolB exonuclease-like 3'-5' exonuclease